MEYADLIDADPAPREITPTGRRYAAAQSTYAWCVLIVIFLVLPSIIALSFTSSSTVFINLALTLAMAVAAGWWAARKRARLRKVLVDGTQRPARIRNVSHLVVRRSGFAVGRRVTIGIEVDGRRTTCVSWAGDLEEAESGAWIRVLVHPEVPDLVVPVVSVT
ncbi:MAG TPA: hypothetical protein VL326_22130 [Kofleriaceae bacterium]|nr:hypothetical protein [Kofleriaceae bacterium]